MFNKKYEEVEKEFWDNVDKQIQSRIFEKEKLGETTMKREIEFRGKTVKGDWVYGSFLQLEYPKTYTYIVDRYGTIECDNVEGMFEVIPETVGQYTGIKDKNGKKVYAGDIVYCSYCNCEVVFGVYGACDYKTVGFFMKVNEALFTDEEDNFVYWGFEDGDKIEVLGNVFDNPELLNKIEYSKESDNGREEKN